MKFREYAENLRQLRISTKKNPGKAGFFLNNGSWIRTMETELYMESRGRINQFGLVNLFYVDSDVDAQSTEAQLIRAGVWDTYQIGWLVVSIKGTTIILAKVSPSEKTDLRTGWITSDGRIVLKETNL